MSANIIRTNVKPNLTSNEKNRYKQAAEHFMRGAGDFYIEHYAQVRKSIDIDYIKNKFQESYNKVIDDFKQKIEEKVDYLKEASKEGLSRFVDFALDGSIVVLGVIAFMPDKVADILKKFVNFIKPAINVTTDYFLQFSNFIRRLMGNIDVYGEIKKSLYYVGDMLSDIFDKVGDYINMFFNGEWGEIFTIMIESTTAAAFNRSFESSFGRLLGIFFDTVDVNVRQRPDLYNFCKYGPATLQEVNETERLFAKIAGESFRGDNLAGFDNTGWVAVFDTTGGGSAKNYYPADNISKFRDLTNAVHLKFAAVASEYAKDSPLTNPFASENPYKSKKYQEALASANNFMNTKIDIKESSQDVEGKYFHYKGDSFNEVIKKLDGFESFFKYSTDEVVIESLNRWKVIKETIEKRRNVKGFPRGTSAINLKESNEMLLIMMVLVTTKRRIVLEEMSNSEIESHNFRENSELNNRVSFLKSIHEKRARDIGFERLHTLANFKEVFEKVILKPKLHPEGGYSEDMFNKKIEHLEGKSKSGLTSKELDRPKTFGLFSSLMLSDLFEGQVSVFKVANLIKAIRDELKATTMSSGHNGRINRHQIYFFNNYSTMSDSNIKAMSLKYEEDEPKKGEKVDNSRLDVEEKSLAKQMKNTTTNIEMSLRLCEEYRNVKEYERDIMEQRDALVTDILEGMSLLVERKEKIYKYTNNS